MDEGSHSNIQDEMKVTQKAGDNSIQIGHAKNVKVNKNTYNLSRHSIVLALIIVGVVIVGLGGYIWYSRFDYSPMGGDMNIVVVPFSEKRSWGYSSCTLGRRISQVFYNQLIEDAKSNENGLNVEIHQPSSLMAFWGINSDHRAFEKRAQALSEKLNAQIVVYGLISHDEYGDPLVSVYVYISPLNFGDAQELLDALSGESDIGTFHVVGEEVNSSDLKAQNKELRERVNIFSLLIKALGTYLSEDPDLALKYLQQASKPILWPNSDGLEVVYLIMGNIYLHKAQNLLGPESIDATYRILQHAKDAFERANGITMSNPTKGRYARAFIGLAGIESLMAIAPVFVSGSFTDMDLSALQRKHSYLQDALSAEYSPASADIAEKVSYGFAQLEMAYYQLDGDNDHLENANAHYQTVINSYCEGNQRVREIAAPSYSGLAFIAWYSNQEKAAIEFFDLAYRTTRILGFKAQILAQQGNVYYEMQDYQSALQKYQEALSRRRDLERAIPEKIPEIENRIKKILEGETQ